MRGTLLQIRKIVMDQTH